jgi:peptidoglycan-associated lipoprotein
MKMRSATLALIVATLSTFAACKSAPKQEDTAPASPTTIDENTLGDSDSGKAMGLQTIHFPYDSFVLDSEAKKMLNADAQILKDKPSVKIQIEGHCDARGGIQYNIALGEKRANAVKRYLEDRGIAGDRITTISYGKERLLDTSGTEEANAKNRRANFVVTSR